jgi:hypothetical protein
VGVEGPALGYGATDHIRTARVCCDSDPRLGRIVVESVAGAPDVGVRTGGIDIGSDSFEIERAPGFEIEMELVPRPSPTVGIAAHETTS